MDKIASIIEAHEHLWMRAWIQRDRNQMKALAARDFIFVLGSESTAILDRASWLEAATTRFRCGSYRLDDVYVRRHGSVAVFAARMTIEARMETHDWSGATWVPNLWKRSKVRRKWQLLERTVSRPDTDPEMPGAIRSMQLWR